MNRYLFWLVLLATPSMAGACAVCDSDIAIAVRAGLFDQTFLPTLIEVLAPFPAIGLAIYAISRYLPE